MKVTKAAAAIFLVAIGFPKADTWDVNKLTEGLKHAAKHKEEADIPEDRKASFKKLVEAKGDIEVVDDGKAPDPEKMKAAKKAREGRHRSTLVKKMQKAHPEKAREYNKRSRNKNKYKYQPRKDRKPRDRFGCIVGSISAKVNSAVNGDWMNEEDIAKKCGLGLTKTRGRLYLAAEQKVFERRRMIQYRVRPGALDKKPKKPQIRTPLKDEKKEDAVR